MYQDFLAEKMIMYVVVISHKEDVLVICLLISVLWIIALIDILTSMSF